MTPRIFSTDRRRLERQLMARRGSVRLTIVILTLLGILAMSVEFYLFSR
jgi:hypothetical protein